MITAMPNVDADEYPELHEFIARYASRYEYRLNGSSLWRDASAPASTTFFLREFQMAAQETGKPMLPLELPDHFVELPARLPLLRGWCSECELAYVITQDTDLFIVQHVDDEAFEEDLADIAEVVAAGGRCRELVCEF